MTEMFGEAWSPMSVPDLAPDDDDDIVIGAENFMFDLNSIVFCHCYLSMYTLSFHLFLCSCNYHCSWWTGFIKKTLINQSRS